MKLDPNRREAEIGRLSTLEPDLKSIRQGIAAACDRLTLGLLEIHRLSASRLEPPLHLPDLGVEINSVPDLFTDLAGRSRRLLQLSPDQRALLVPVRAGDEPLGLLRFTRDGRPFTDPERELASDISANVAPALERLRLREEVKARDVRIKMIAQI